MKRLERVGWALVVLSILLPLGGIWWWALDDVPSRAAVALVVTTLATTIMGFGLVGVANPATPRRKEP